MRSAIALALVLTIPGVASGQSAGADEAAIRDVIRRHDETRSNADWKAVGNLFMEDAAVLTSAGEWRRGPAQIAKGGAASAAGPYKGGKYSTKIDSVRLLAPTVALADGTFEIGNIPGGNRRGHSTYVLVKTGGAWKIAATRSMVPTAAGPTPSR